MLRSPQRAVSTPQAPDDGLPDAAKPLKPFSTCLASGCYLVLPGNCCANLHARAWAASATPPPTPAGRCRHLQPLVGRTVRPPTQWVCLCEYCEGPSRARAWPGKPLSASGPQGCTQNLRPPALALVKHLRCPGTCYHCPQQKQRWRGLSCGGEAVPRSRLLRP